MFDFVYELCNFIYKKKTNLNNLQVLNFNMYVMTITCGKSNQIIFLTYDISHFIWRQMLRFNPIN